jgi:hypothetical protein
VQVVQFTGGARGVERKRVEQRLAWANSDLCRVLGGQSQVSEFQRRYLDEMMEPGTVLFYNKFVVHGWK